MTTSTRAAGTPPLRWELTGLALADRGILALAQPVDDAPDAFRAAVLSELAELGRAEAYYRQSVWWATVLHFAAPVPDPAGLVDWVDARTSLTPFPVSADRAEVVRYVPHQARERVRVQRAGIVGLEL